MTKVSSVASSSNGSQRRWRKDLWPAWSIQRVFFSGGCITIAWLKVVHSITTFRLSFLLLRFTPKKKEFCLVRAIKIITYMKRSRRESRLTGQQLDGSVDGFLRHTEGRHDLSVWPQCQKQEPAALLFLSAFWNDDEIMDRELSGWTWQQQ